MLLLQSPFSLMGWGQGEIEQVPLADVIKDKIIARIPCWEATDSSAHRDKNPPTLKAHKERKGEVTLSRGTQTPWRVITTSHVPRLCSPPFAVAGKGEAGWCWAVARLWTKYSRAKRKRNSGEGMKTHQETTNGFGRHAETQCRRASATWPYAIPRVSRLQFPCPADHEPRAPRRTRPEDPVAPHTRVHQLHAGINYGLK